ncbi:hypothetical protein XPA_008541 [Xanthoria parietina]
MDTKPLWEIFNAQRVDESLEQQTVFDFHDYLEFWNNDDRNHVDQTVQPAAAILHHVKEQYQRLKVDPSESAVLQPSQLQPYFNADTAKDFLLELFDPEQAATYGPAFLNDCEIIYSNFGVTGGPKLL